MAVSEEVWGWSKTAASNATADSSINWAEGQTPGSVNNSARSMMAAIAKLRDDQGGQLTLAGGTTAYTLTTNQVLDTLADGVRVHAVVNSTNTGASTLAVDGLTAKAIRVVAGSADQACVGGELQAAEHAVFQYDASANSAAGAWILLNPARAVVTIASGSLPAATVQDITGIPATYRALQLVITGASSDTATRRVCVRLSTDNGSSFIAANYQGAAFDSAGSNLAVSTFFAAIPATAAAAATASMALHIINYQGGLYPQCTYSGTDGAGGYYMGAGFSGASTSAVNAIRVLWDGSGKFDTGTYVLYGIR